MRESSSALRANLGGIVDFGAGPNDGREENLRAMIDAVRQYGNYK